MSSRDEALLTIRPLLPNARIIDGMSSEEYFQNKTLRPIAKLHNDLLVLVFRNYIKKRKNVFYNLTLEKRLSYIDNAINKDIKFRNSLKGMFIGQFTTNEYCLYIENSSALNKRIANLSKERLKSNIQLLEPLEISV